MNFRAIRVHHLFRGRSAQTLFDQILVSASNFITGIILVRGLGLVEFGKFTVAYVVLLLANSVQLSFISSPMITLGSLCPDAMIGNALSGECTACSWLFGAVASPAAVAAVAIYFIVDRTGIPTGFLLPFAAAVALYLMQDWLRRYFFTVGKPSAAVWNDTISYVGQVISLAILWVAHRLTIETAFWAIAITSGLAFASVLLSIGFAAIAQKCATHGAAQGEISVELGISNQLQWLVYQGAMLIGANVAGPQAAGGVRATQNVIGPVNIAFQAMENIVPIRAAEEMRRGGIQKAAGFLFRFGLAGFLALLILFSAASLVSARFLAFFYGHELRLYAGVLNLQMVYFLLAWPIRQLTFLFRTIESTRPILFASIVAAVVSISLVYPMVRSYGALGIVMAAVAGQICNLLYLVVAWMRVASITRGKIATAQPS